MRPDALAARVIRALAARTGVPPGDVEDIIMGCAFPEGEQGMNVARLIGLLAQLPISVAAVTRIRFSATGCKSRVLKSRCTRADRRLLTPRRREEHAALEAARTRESGREFAGDCRCRAGMNGTRSLSVVKQNVPQRDG